MDVDETRYVAMARDMFNSKDFLTLYLNGEYFFEKPPLYFWHECLSFFVFHGQINEFSARFPVAMLGLALSLAVYFTSSHWINKKFGIYVTLIMATSLEFIILAKYAILDIVLAFYICLAIMCFISTYFCKKNHLKIYWWLFYIFMGLGVMSKGLPAFIIPFGGAFICSLLTKRLKILFNPKYFLVGIILFFLIVLPWHIVMLKIHGKVFFDEYIVKHHIQRFFTSDDIGRKQPFYYYFVTLLWGFIPWIFSMISVIFYRIINIKTNRFYTKYFDFNDLDNTHKLIFLSLVFIFWILLFFSVSSTKLVTYILPIYYPLAIVMGLVWKDYTENKMYTKTINFSVIFVAIVALLGFVSAILSKYVLPSDIYVYVSGIRYFCIIVLFLLGIFSLFFLKYKKYQNIFILYVAFMLTASMFGTKKFFELDYKFGQNELVEFAKYAKQQDYTISANALNRKYSLLFYNDKMIDYNSEDTDINLINKELSKDNNFVILKKVNYNGIKDKLNHRIVKNGNKYIMIEGI